jgi:hypothetical protein
MQRGKLVYNQATIQGFERLKMIGLSSSLKGQFGYPIEDQKRVQYPDNRGKITFGLCPMYQKTTFLPKHHQHTYPPSRYRNILDLEWQQTHELDTHTTKCGLCTLSRRL